MKNKSTLKLGGFALGLLLLVAGLGVLLVYLLLPIIGLWTVLALLGYVSVVGVGMWIGARDKEEKGC